MNKIEKVCKNCKFGFVDELKDTICVNGDSEYCTNYVEKNHSCDSWEENE